MTVSIANTNLADSFNSWRLNTNFAATVISNNVVTVNPHGDANRGGQAVGNGHVTGTFTATELRAYTMRGGNTSVSGDLTLASNVSIAGIDAVNFDVNANTSFNANVLFNQTGAETVILPDVSRVRISGGSQGEFLRIATNTNTPEFKALTLRDITDMSSNSADLILSSANTSFSEEYNTPSLYFAAGPTGQDRIRVYGDGDATAGDSDLRVELVATDGDSAFIIADSANTAAHSLFANGTATSTGRYTVGGLTSTDHVMPNADNSYDLGSDTVRWKDLYIDGTANVDSLYVSSGAGQGVATSLIPTIDDTKNLGSTNRAWGDFYQRGIARLNDTRAVKIGVSTTLNVNGAATFAGLATFSGDRVTAGNTFIGKLDVSGQTTVAALHANGNVDTDGNLTVDGSTNLNGAITLGDASTDTITVKGNFANQSTTGTATFNGAVNLGNASTDDISIDGSVATNIIPKKTAGGAGPNLGSRTLQWDEVHANTVYANTIVVDNDFTVEGDLNVQGSTSLASGQTFTSPIGRFTNVVSTDTATFEGTVYLGDASSDSIHVGGRFRNTLEPAAGLRIDIGDSTRRWTNVWANTVNSRIARVSGNTHLEGDVFNGSNKIISTNGTIYANNAVNADSILNTMIQNDHIALGTNGTGSDFDVALGETLAINEGEGINVTLAANTVTIAAELATTSNKGVASFNSNRFSVSSGAVDIATGGIGATQLASTLTAGEAGTFGSATKIPQLTIDVDGRITAVANVDVGGVASLTYTASNNTIDLGLATGTIYNVAIDAATTTSGTGRGVASFDSGDFSLTSGHVSLKDASTGAVLAINGTANEVNVSRTNGTVTIGQPNDVTIGRDLTVTRNLLVGNNITIEGNLIVTGTTTTVNTEELSVSNTFIKLNHDLGSGTAPSENAGLIVNRGSANTVQLRYNETSDRWQFTNSGLNYSNIPVPSEYDNYGSWTIQDHDGTSYTVTSGDTLSIKEGNGIDSNFTADDQLTITNTKPFDDLTFTDGDGTSVTMTNNQYMKFVEGSGININFTDTSSGTSGDPYDLTIENTDKGSSQNIFKTLAVTDTDSGYTWAETGSVSADSNADTATFVSGTGVDIDVDGTNDAIRIAIGQAVATTSDVQFRSVDVGVVSGVGANGQIRATNEIISFYSDERLKDIEGNIPDALDKVKSLNGFYYTPNETAQGLGLGSERHVGVSAQQVESILPEIIRDAPVDGEYKTVQYEKLVPLLIEAIKELSAEVDRLKNK